MNDAVDLVDMELNMKRILFLLTFSLIYSDILLAAKVLKVKNGKLLVLLTRAEQSQVIEGDMVTLTNESLDSIDGKLVRLKDGRKALITSEDFVEYKEGDFIDVQCQSDEEDEEDEDEVADEEDEGC